MWQRVGDLRVWFAAPDRDWIFLRVVFLLAEMLAEVVGACGVPEGAQ